MIPKSCLINVSKNLFKNKTQPLLLAGMFWHLLTVKTFLSWRQKTKHKNAAISGIYFLRLASPYAKSAVTSFMRRTLSLQFFVTVGVLSAAAA